MASNPSSARNTFFKELKPRCVAINNLAIRSSDKKARSNDLITVTEELSNLLESQVNRDASVLDEKLADYVFFPLSNILRSQHEHSTRMTELTVKCLRILIQDGWRSKIPKELSQQLLILITFILDGVPGKKRSETVPEELKLEAFRALTSLVRATGSSASGAASLVEADSIPALGHTVTVVLGATTDGVTPDIQLEALLSLEALLNAIKDPVAAATFLPGTVSSLSRLLTPPTAWKTPKRVLVKGIEVLKVVLVGVLGDMKTMGIVKKQSDGSSETKTEGQVLTASWLRATADQVKLALANVFKLRSHGSEDVQVALERLCLVLLDECHKSLATCTPIIVESAMILSSESDNQSLLSSSLNTSLSDLASIFPELTDTIKMTVYSWVTALPRVMQSSDDEVKRQAIHNLRKGQRFMSTLRIDSTTLSDSLAASLRDSVTALIASTRSSSYLAEMTSSGVELNSGGLVSAGATHTFQPVLMSEVTQTSTRLELVGLIAKSGSLLHQTRLAADMLDYVRGSTGNNQIASYWLAFELVKSGLAQSSDLDDFLDLSSIALLTDEPEHALQELYTFSVAVLDSAGNEEGLDWRMKALALEVTTFVASRMGADFRPELIDVLYPIATFLGSTVPQLREHSIVSLNSIAASSGYSNVADLIIDNVDYMVNSISLRLDTFDISPASTQVLRMMVKLTGPKLIPFLDDVVASIFAALDNYHGYPLFVENLFSVLVEIVHQGSVSDQMLLGDDSRARSDHRKQVPPLATIQDIGEILDQRSERKRKRLEEKHEQTASSHPKTPWTTSKTSHFQEENDEKEETDEPGQAVEENPVPKTPTYALLLRITNLTQHYLTSPTPTLRKSLLDLLTNVCPTLSSDEVTFLPLVNSLWPVLISRLYDPEPFVVVSACKALSALCASAGDFLSTRFKTEWFDGLGKWCIRAKSNVKQGPGAGRGQNKTGNKGAGVASGLVIPIRSMNAMNVKGTSQTSDAVTYSGLGKFTQAAQIWEAVQKLLVALVSFVRVEDDVFEQILDLLADSLASMPEAREVLEVVNADAVWLRMFEKGLVEVHARPEGVGMNFAVL
ncbi:HEAT repeat protein [Pseudomassariella vexata]|uniref:HEAT repeat protein n=1 Tax=Pseudomassariella vexata TaxID=1141098 RepID=A0A1Y2EEI6_9PEZI|nr:HEAT repeat protein [Pseudomassariella vexata]ORY69981.1 HEAT repeat protein [Pseudomassariella vexata]